MADPKPSVLPPGIAVQPSNITTEAEFGKWLAHQTTETQDYYLFQNPDYTSETANGGAKKQLNLIKQALETERNEAFKKGDILPGVSESGQGTTLDERGRAAGLEAKGIRGIDEAASSVSQNINDYTYTPEMDQGAGYALPDKLGYYGDRPFDHLQAINEKAIDQARTDTAGVDAQKYALGEMRSNYAQGGLSAIDRARMAESQRVREAQARGAREAVRANAAEQGRLGGNLSFLLQQKANQDAAGGRAMDDLETQSLALQRKDAMLRGMGDIGGSVQAANDAIDHFNAQGRRDVEHNNAVAGNHANEVNFDETMGREHTDMDTRNKGVATQFAVDTNRSAANTDRTNGARQYNVGPTGGRRGMFRDQLAAAEASAGQGNVAAQLSSGFAHDDAAAQAASDAAKAEWIKGGLEVPIDAFTGWVTSPKKT
jgi:hypothetical protein